MVSEIPKSELTLSMTPNLTNENTIIHFKLRKYATANLVLKMYKFDKTKIGIHFFKTCTDQTL